MKYLIVNADDFGASRGINRGVLEAHRYGIVSSTSLMVNTPFSAEAAKLAVGARYLSVGLHADLREELAADAGSPGTLRKALRQQFARFKTLMGRRPTHLDSHHNVHRDPRLLPHFLALAAEQDLPLREQPPVRYFSSFYGQWNGSTHLEQISVASLAQMLETEIGPGITELSCHPGYVDADLASGYAAERTVELRTLCDPIIRRRLSDLAVRLVNYQDFEQLRPRVAAAA